jgi:formylglycine-generating enzyme required for sulfatase activity
MKKYLSIKQRADYSAMEPDTIQKNEVKPESLNRILLRIAGNVALVALLMFTVCQSFAQRHPAEPIMVNVEGGTFTMGCTAEQGNNCDKDEKPAHSVTVSSFSISRYEITQAQWKTIMGTTVSQQRDKGIPDWKLAGEGDNHPMYYISWDEAQEFIARLNAVTGKNYRLPTEAEWEYAARGGNRSQGYRYSGSNNIGEVAWYDSHTHSVGMKKANELGIYDMSGNVWEWCQDLYGAYSASSQQNPVGASNGSDRVYRGGGWNDFNALCRVANRRSSGTTARLRLGFRVVLPYQPASLSHVSERVLPEGEGGTTEAKRQNKKTRHPAEPEMVKVEGGAFIMGCTSEQGDDCFPDEKPIHSVTVQSFQIGKYEVTQAQWKAIMGTTVRKQRDKVDPSWPLGGEGNNYPMYYVSWDEAQEFIRRLNVATGKSYRLPTEAEWEYAARGGNRSQDYKYSGSNDLGEVAWYDDNSGSQTHPVGKKKANELGIHDMSGNVYEWCQDWYGGYSASSQQNPVGAGNGSYRVHRGGSWSLIEFNCRVTFRAYYSSGGRHDRLGFRVVLP